MIKIGSIVKYSPEWCSPGERKLLFVVKENCLNPVTGELSRCLIQSLNSNLAFQISDTVEDYMLEGTNFNIGDLSEA